MRDVAAVHSTLWPTESGEGILEVGLLIGTIKPTAIADESNEPETLDVQSGVSE